MTGDLFEGLLLLWVIVCAFLLVGKWFEAKPEHAETFARVVRLVPRRSDQTGTTATGDSLRDND